MQFSPQRQSGVTLVEVMIALGVIAVMIVAVGFSVMTYVDARSELISDMKGLYLAEEGYEMLRMVRDEDWTIIDSLTVGDTYSFAVTTTTISVVSGVEVIDTDFQRSFVVSDVRRNVNDDIEIAAGFVDGGARFVTVSVFGPTGTTSLSAVLTNLHAI
jgi:prepilin-type N-terminal cleavage/methylation domain-containing protein